MDETRQLELFEFLRTNLSVDVNMDTEYETYGEYATCSVSIRIRNPETGEYEEMASGYDSLCINRD
jgi:hypothetical protein